MKKLCMASAKAAIAKPRRVLALLTLFSVLGFPNPVSAENFNQIYVFGDSLSDVGNVLQATNGQYPPNPPYFQGRYSNGPVWADYLASKLKLKSSTETNFAYGGATTGNSRQITPGLLAQIETFKATHSAANPRALYVVWAGANDYLRGATDSTVPINNLAIAVKSLSAAGAKNIVVVNLPDLGKLPGTRTTQRSASLNVLTKKHNSGLAASLNGLRQQLNSDIKITYLDVNSLYNQVTNNPKKFGFTNVTNACVSRSKICNNPNEYLFWDSIHPTTAAHKLFVELAFPALKSTLEPRTVSSSQTTVEPTIAVGGIILLGAVGGGLIVTRIQGMKNKS
ncbi:MULTISPECIES: SGNH/GDSL hydrolase family protein [unclassified Coleofasciculus]|uniref:SGNH/GDSL hydrolase family protein n=1 Tax=Cyanophyceae TaxID=3028117 RepID=UPI001F54A11C|nr:MULTISPECIES: SGNH/GDSL hydrolase family protein [unclassified Coleofasciculus]